MQKHLNLKLGNLSTECPLDPFCGCLLAPGNMFWWWLIVTQTDWRKLDNTIQTTWRQELALTEVKVTRMKTIKHREGDANAFSGNLKAAVSFDRGIKGNEDAAHVWSQAPVLIPGQRYWLAIIGWGKAFYHRQCTHHLHWLTGLPVSIVLVPHMLTPCLGLVEIVINILQSLSLHVTVFNITSNLTILIWSSYMITSFIMSLLW